MLSNGKSKRGGRGGRSGGGVRINSGGRSNGVGGSSSHSSNPSSYETGSVSRPVLPSQYPSSSQQRPLRQPQPAAQASQPMYMNPHHQPPPPPNPEHQPPPPPNPEHQPPPQEPNHEQQDFQQLLDAVMALPGRQRLPILSQEDIPDRETIWFGQDGGKLARVISGIFRRKFDGPYFSWKVTPIHIQERYFRTFARKYNWDSGITDLVRENFLTIARRRMKGIVSQAKKSGEMPVWIHPDLWVEMWNHWDTPEAVYKSSNASECRNSDRGGLGVHKHLSGQKSYVQVRQNLEEKLGRPVSLGEVFMSTHTRSDGSFVDQKAKHVADAYEKNLEEKLSEIDVDGSETSDPSSQQSTQRTLTIQEKDDIFLKCTFTDNKGNPFGLGQLKETIKKGKRKESYGSSSSSSSLLEMQEDLVAARRKLAEVDQENARRDEERRKDQSRITSLEMMVSYMRNKDPAFAEFLATQQPEATAAATVASQPPTTAAATAAAIPPANAPYSSPAATSPMSNTSSSSPLA